MNLCIDVRLNNHEVKECSYNTMVAKYNLARNFDSQITRPDSLCVILHSINFCQKNKLGWKSDHK